MQVEFKSFEDWGTDMFAITDFKDITNDDTNYYMAGAVIFEDDSVESVKSFIDMAAEAGSAIVMIDFSNIINRYKEYTDEFRKQLSSYEDELAEWGYKDLESYECRIAYGLTD
mgnify:CR=1 FL=1